MSFSYFFLTFFNLFKHLKNIYLDNDGFFIHKNFDMCPILPLERGKVWVHIMAQIECMPFYRIKPPPRINKHSFFNVSMDILSIRATYLIYYHCHLALFHKKPDRTFPPKPCTCRWNLKNHVNNENYIT